MHRAFRSGLGMSIYDEGAVGGGGGGYGGGGRSGWIYQRGSDGRYTSVFYSPSQPQPSGTSVGQGSRGAGGSAATATIILNPQIPAPTTQVNSSVQTTSTIQESRNEFTGAHLLILLALVFAFGK